MNAQTEAGPSQARPDLSKTHAERGTATRERVLGEAHVAKARAAENPFDAPFQALITEAAWGRVWGSPQLTLRERSLITLAVLAAGGHWDEFAMHVEATHRTGASADDVREALMHVAIYAGVPAANKAIKIAKPLLACAEADPA